MHHVVQPTYNLPHVVQRRQWCFLHRAGKNKGIAPHGACLRMDETQSNSVPRQPEEPTPEQVLEEMRRCEPYTASDFEELFGDVSRWTIQRRLETLYDDGRVNKKKHAENRVSWWRGCGGE